jgi:hypothetical protein
VQVGLPVSYFRDALHIAEDEERRNGKNRPLREEVRTRRMRCACSTGSLYWVSSVKVWKPLRTDCGGQDVFDVDPLRGIVTGVARGAVASFFLVLD